MTITVVQPLSMGETFKAFWNTWGDAIALVGAGTVGAFSTFLVDQLKSRRLHKK
jgi:hypothetical protein